MPRADPVVPARFICGRRQKVTLGAHPPAQGGPRAMKVGCAPKTLPFTGIYTALTVKMGAAAVFVFYCVPQFIEGDTKGQRGPEDGPSVRAPTHKPQVFIRLGCVVQSSWDLAYQMFLLSGPSDVS